MEGFLDNLVSDPIQDAVDETSGLLRPIFFPEFNRLIQRHFWRDIFTIKKLEDGHAEDVSIDEIHAVQAPVFRILTDELVDLLTVFLDAMNNPFGERIVRVPW